MSQASGDIAIAVLRRNGSIAVPVWLWLDDAWVDFATLTGAQFSAWVTARLGTDEAIDPATGGPRPRMNGVTISRTQW